MQIKTNEAQGREAEARGEAAYVRLTGEAEAARTQAIGLAEAKAAEALGLARAVGFEAQTEALGAPATALVAVANAVADGHVTVVPEVLVTGGGGSLDGLAATLMRSLTSGVGDEPDDTAPAPSPSTLRSSAPEAGRPPSSSSPRCPKSTPPASLRRRRSVSPSPCCTESRCGGVPTAPSVSAE